MSTTTKIIAGTALAVSLPFILKFLRNYFKANAKKYIYPNEIDFSVKATNESFNENIEEQLIEWSKKYPNGCTISFGDNLKILVLNSVDAIREFSKNDGIANRPQIFLFDVISRHFKGSFFRMYDSDLNEVRKTTLQAIHKLVFSNPEAEHLIVDELERFFEFIHKDVMKNGNTGVLENAEVFLQQVLVNIIFRVAIDVRFDYDLDKNAAVKTQIKHMSTLLTALNLPELSKVNAKNAGSPAHAKTVEFLSGILGSMYDFITGAVVGYKQNADPHETEARTIADMLLQKQRDEIKKKLKLESSDLYSDNDIIVQVFTAFLATSGTSGFTLAWALHYLSQSPEVSGKLVKEIDDICGNTHAIGLKHRANMLYTSAVIEEVLRLSSTQAVIPRSTCTEINLNGNCIPANTPVMLNTFGIHHNPNYWSNPREFKPERWLNADGKSLKLNKDCYLPFGAAPRTCVGDTLSKTLLFAIVTNLMHRYTFEYVEVKHESKNEGILGVMRSPHEFNLRIKQKN